MSPSFDSARVGDVDVPRGLEVFDEASIDLLKARVLLRRVDRKYLLSKQALNAFLARLEADHLVLRTEGRLAGRYHTCYFDTPDRQTYEDHRRGRLPRYKIRARHHVDRRMSFLEIKCKRADGHTLKSVMDRPFGANHLDRQALRFISEHCPIEGALLSRRVSMIFHRATLLSNRVDERVTIDWGLELFDDQRRERLPQIVIVEIKQGRFSNHTPAVQALRALHVRERSLSKYWLATARLALVRTNVFKPTLRAVERLSA